MSRKAAMAALAALSLSVIIPTGGDVGRLSWALAGLAQQTDAPRAEIELIVIGDGLSDEKQAAVQELVTGFRDYLPFDLVRVEWLAPGGETLQENGEAYRPASARNRGIELARGEQCLFLDEDSVPDPGWLKAYYDVRGCGAAYGFRRRLLIKEALRIGIAQPGQAVEYPFLLMWADGYDARRDDLAGSDGQERPAHPGDWFGCNCSAPTAALRAIGGFDAGNCDGGWTCDDIDCAARLARHGIPFVKLTNAFITHLDHPRRKPIGDVQEWLRSICAEERSITLESGQLADRSGEGSEIPNSAPDTDNAAMTPPKKEEGDKTDGED